MNKRAAGDRPIVPGMDAAHTSRPAKPAMEIPAGPHVFSIPNRLDTFMQAIYNKTGLERWNGNPLIEALPVLPKRKVEFSNLVEQCPTVPSASTRRKSEVERLMLVDTIKQIVYPFLQYQDASFAISKMMRDSYVSRNPFTAVDVQRRHAIAAKGADGLPAPRDWHSTAYGVLIIAVSGMGKTTFKDSLLLRVPQLIRHTKYKGKELKLLQIVYITLNFPFDGTMRSLCLQFFRKIDKILGTKFRNRLLVFVASPLWSS